MNLKNQSRFATVGVFLFALTIRLAYTYSVIQKIPLKWLPYQNHTRAIQLLNGETIFYPEAWSSFYIVLSGFYKVFNIFEIGEHQTTLFIYAQSTMGAISIVLFYLICKKLFSTKTSLASAIILSLYYPLIYLGTLILSETLFFLALLSALYLLIVPKNTNITLVISGVFLGIATIVRPIIIPFIPIILIWLFLTSKKGSALKVLIPLLPIVSIILFISFINAQIGKHNRFAFSSNIGVNTAIANCNIKKITYRLDDGESFWFSPPVYWNTNLPEITTSEPFYNNWHYLQMGFNCIINNPFQLVKNLDHVKNIFSSSFYPNFNPVFYHFNLINLWKIPTAILLLTSLSYLFVKKNKDNKKTSYQRKTYWLLLGLFFSMVLAVYVSNPGEERYLAPYFFVLIPYGIYNITIYFSNKFR